VNTLIDILIWLAIAAATTALVWLYGASWRAVAKALTEAAEHPTQEAATDHVPIAPKETLHPQTAAAAVGEPS
jgi:hypothetical protein